MQPQPAEILKQFVVYRGSSMHPLLRDGDILRIAAYGRALPRRGDVILFFLPDEDHGIVHRVVAVRKEKVETRGDNNRHTDLGWIKRENIVGRVVEAFSSDYAVTVHGGKKGLLIHYALRLFLFLKMALKPILKQAGWLQKGRRVFRASLEVVR
ncbi:MAG: signal peptidase I [candidate division KSB1 bacterium]|nr:signal peptidase I [candidate division KSB1 bacterium]